MSNQHALSFLMTLRAEKAGRITQLEKEIEDIRHELVHIDNVIPLAGDGEIDPEAIPARQRFPRQDVWFAHGEKTRIIYDVLKQLPEGEAVPARTVVDHAMRVK